MTTEPSYFLPSGSRFAFFLVLFTLLRLIPRMRSAVIGALATMDSLQLRGGRKLDPNAVAEFKRAYITFRVALNSLADFALGTKVLRYHLRPKLHQMGHVVYHYLPKNPRYFQCYADEDMVARMKRVAVASHPLHVSRLAMLRYIINVCMKWAGDGATV